MNGEEKSVQSRIGWDRFLGATWIPGVTYFVWLAVLLGISEWGEGSLGRYAAMLVILILGFNLIWVGVAVIWNFIKARFSAAGINLLLLPLIFFLNIKVLNKVFVSFGPPGEGKNDQSEVQHNSAVRETEEND